MELDPLTVLDNVIDIFRPVLDMKYQTDRLLYAVCLVVHKGNHTAIIFSPLAEVSGAI